MSHTSPVEPPMETAASLDSRALASYFERSYGLGLWAVVGLGIRASDLGFQVSGLGFALDFAFRDPFRG